MSKNNAEKNLEYDSDSDESIEDECENETKVDVGLIDVEVDDLTPEERRVNRILLKSPFFPNKVGGKPAWLDYSALPLAVGASFVSNNNSTKPPIQLKCDNCQSQLTFLLQIYAPITTTDKYYNQIESHIDHLFHRVLYVFVCANTQCAPNNSRTFKVLRVQLRRENNFLSDEPPPNSDSEPSQIEAHLISYYKNLHEKNLFNLCTVCGLFSTKKCAKCAFSYYCCQAHQLFDWSKAMHKEVCPKYVQCLSGNDSNGLMKLFLDNESLVMEKCVSEKLSTVPVFPEYEIFIEPEVVDLKKCKEKKEDKYDVKKLTQDLEINMSLDTELDDLKETDSDKDFEKFKKLTDHESTQIIRYDRGGQPLWVTKYAKLAEAKIPPCSHCNSKRIFEFQINPQLLCYLNLDEAKQLNSIDWAGVYIYTCAKSCTAANGSYVDEFIYKQDFIS